MVAVSSAWVTFSASSAKSRKAVRLREGEALVRKLRRSEFTLEDYRDQNETDPEDGPLEQVLSMIPGVGGALKGVDTDAGEQD